MKILELEWCVRHRERLTPEEVQQIEYFDGFKLHGKGDVNLPAYRFTQLLETLRAIYKKYTDAVLEDHLMMVDYEEGQFVVRCGCGAQTPMTIMLDGLIRQYRRAKPYFMVGGAGNTGFPSDLSDTKDHFTVGCSVCGDKFNTKKISFKLTDQAREAKSFEDLEQAVQGHEI